MKKTTNKKENYTYSFPIKQKLINEFIICNNLESKILNKLTTSYLVSFLIYIWSNSSKLITKTVNGEKYVRASTQFILDNNPLLGIKKRQVDNYISNLTKNNFIKILDSDKTKRYINISIELREDNNQNKTIEQKQINENLKNEIDLLIKELGEYFGKTTAKMQNDICYFLNNKVIEEIPRFKKQFKYYKLYKTQSREKIHRFESFCKEWNQQDWEILYKNILSTEEKEQVLPYRKNIS
ncbi:hypothetical protein EGM88_14735 [Aureibaculum marinum]|uniref:Uncharacterized protein n=1 Tax=Aureibaculum marinum TaxID=2487930 RepID=A0A3N4N677_9FLAO|nr:hypothetical protein [Aureibaculum marinum]RPD91621.1 hypothetical protein EGM88_14735 [Aureibaculum marinum]